MRAIILAICLIFCLIVSSQTIIGEIVKPTFVEGDFAEYDVTVEASEDSEKYEKNIHEIKGIEKIIIDNIEYDARLIKILKYNNLSLEGEIYKEYFYNETRYVEDSSSASMKIITNPMTGHSIEYIYHTPFPQFDFPIDLGYSEIITGDYDIITTTSTQTQSLKTKREVTEKVQVETEAGTFECYVIKVSAENSPNYSNYYYNEAVGGYFHVKYESFQNDILKYAEEVISYKYSGSTGDENGNADDKKDNGDTSQDNGDQTVGFEIILVIFAITIILFWKKKNKNW